MKLLSSFYWLAYFHGCCAVFKRGPFFYRLSRRWVSLPAFQAFWMGWFSRHDLVAALNRAAPAEAVLQRLGLGGCHV